jgi:NAD(P)-dependent dehydrogenase (short-subunit alcohol dehydrogenase family)
MSEHSPKQYNNPVTATLKGITDLFRKRERVGSLNPADRLDGKRILITGSSSGLGLAAAKALARRGGEIIMAVRSGIPERGEEVKRSAGGGEVHMLRVDLSDLDSVRSLAQEVRNRFGTIDILICNAAVVALKARKTPQGLDEMFTVNYLAKFLLVNKLLEYQCFNTAGGSVPRIIFVSSESHRNPSGFEWDSFGDFIPFGAGKTVERYGYYKLLMTTFARELERRLNGGEGDSYRVFAHCPGPVNSNIAREAPSAFKPLLKVVFSLFFRSPEKACEPVVYLAASPDMESRSWDYLFLMSRKPVDDKAGDRKNGQQLWERSARLLGEMGFPMSTDG